MLLHASLLPPRSSCHASPSLSHLPGPGQGLLGFNAGVSAIVFGNTAQYPTYPLASRVRRELHCCLPAAQPMGLLCAATLSPTHGALDVSVCARARVCVFLSLSLSACEGRNDSATVDLPMIGTSHNVFLELTEAINLGPQMANVVTSGTVRAHTHTHTHAHTHA